MALLGRPAAAGRPSAVGTAAAKPPLRPAPIHRPRPRRKAAAVPPSATSRDGPASENNLFEEQPYRALDPGQLRRVLNFLGYGGGGGGSGGSGGSGGASAPSPSTHPPLRVGLIGASKVATYAAIWPARRLAGAVEIAGVAARDAARAEAYARAHRLPRAYASYEALLADEAIQAVYIGLPNGAHGRWAAAALAAGKHVLCEKPFAANADEASHVMALARAARRVCREAFHNAEAPANRHARALIAGGAVGALRELEARVLIPRWAFSADDIRFDARLAGGTMMDAGCYAAHALRFFAGREPARVVGAEAKGVLRGCDTGMVATVAYGDADADAAGGALVGRLDADLRHAGAFPVTKVTATGDRGSLEVDNFVVPFFGHRIAVKDAGGRLLREVSVYGSGESNYFYQLRRFAADVAALESGDPAAEARALAAMERDAADAVANMRLVDAVYAAAPGLEPRQPTERWW